LQCRGSDFVTFSQGVVYPKHSANADKRFKKIDSDGNGKLSLEEFKAGMTAKKE
jgi:hypothetical protein